MKTNKDFGCIAKMIYKQPSEEEIKKFLEKNPWLMKPLIFGEDPPKEQINQEVK